MATTVTEIAEAGLARVVLDPARRAAILRAIAFKLGHDTSFRSIRCVAFPGRDIRAARLYVGLDIRIVFEIAGDHLTIFSVTPTIDDPTG